MLKNLQFKLIHIHRNLPNWFNEYKLGCDTCEEASILHISETSWIRENFDLEIINQFDNIELFYSHINKFMNENFNFDNK